MPAQIDALIVGGGPAGLAAGIALAERGVRTLVCEARAYPVDKPCGEGIMPSGRRDLERLGVLDHLSPADCFEFTGIRYISPSGQMLSGDFREGPGLGVRRTALSAALLARALQLDCLEVRPNCRAIPLSCDASGVLISVDGEEILARLLVGADGLNSRVRQWAAAHPVGSDLRVGPPPVAHLASGASGGATLQNAGPQDARQLPVGADLRVGPSRRSLPPPVAPGCATLQNARRPLVGHTGPTLQNAGPQNAGRWGARQHFRLAPWSRQVEVTWQRGIEAYVTPVSAEQVGVAFLWERRLYPAVRGGAELIPSLLAAFPALTERLHGAEPLSTPRAAGPLERRVPRVVADGVALVGDASGYIDAITGEGLSLAFAHALVLADAAAPRLASRPDGGLLTAGDLLPYARRHSEIGRAYRFFTRLALFISHRPALLDVLIPLLRPVPGAFPRLLSLNMGSRPSAAWRPSGVDIPQPAGGKT